MLYFLNSRAGSRQPPAPPQRRRVIIIGAGLTGVSAAFHLGEHSLLLERRAALEEFHDRANDFTMGAAGVRALGTQGGGADGQRPGTSATERKALFISCSSQSETGAEHSLIHVERWTPPTLGPSFEPAFEMREETLSVRALVPLLRGELRLGAWLVRVSPSLRLIELADGTRFIYDKLLCTLPLASMAFLVMPDLPGRVRHDESLRYWLKDHDIEMADRATQASYGDADELAAGKRVADLIADALATKFRAIGHPNARALRLFEPRLVQATAAPASP